MSHLISLDHIFADSVLDFNMMCEVSIYINGKAFEDIEMLLVGIKGATDDREIFLHQMILDVAQLTPILFDIRVLNFSKQKLFAW